MALLVYSLHNLSLLHSLKINDLIPRNPVIILVGSMKQPPLGVHPNNRRSNSWSKIEMNSKRQNKKQTKPRDVGPRDALASVALILTLDRVAPIRLLL